MENIKKDVDWVIHCVQNDEKKEIEFHTHGLSKHGYRELSIAMNLPLEIGQTIMNDTGLLLLDRGRDFDDMEVIMNVCNAPVYMAVVEDGHQEGRIQTRIIFPDENGLFPWDEGVQDYCVRQIENVRLISFS